MGLVEKKKLWRGRTQKTKIYLCTQPCVCAPLRFSFAPLFRTEADEYQERRRRQRIKEKKVDFTLQKNTGRHNPLLRNTTGKYGHKKRFFFMSNFSDNFRRQKKEREEKRRKHAT